MELPYQDLAQDLLQGLVGEAGDFQSNFPGLFGHLLHCQLLLQVGKQKPQHQVHMTFLQEESTISPQEAEGQMMIVIMLDLKMIMLCLKHCMMISTDLLVLPS
jgi:hypothetical protein